MTQHERAKERVAFAHNDLRAAEVLMRENIFNEVCFHAQQCAEKAIKSFLVFKGKPVPKTHRLVDLLEDAVKLEPTLESFHESCLILDQYYIPARYPDAVIGSKPSGLLLRSEAQEALEAARSIFESIRSRPS